MQLIEVEPIDIVINEKSPRFRTEVGDVEGLADSISRVGQILPIRIDRDKVLIDGGRRLAACILAQQKVVCVFDDSIDKIDELTLRTMELEGNLYRKDYTPGEEALAVRELHRLKQELDPSHTIRDTAKLLGRKSHGTVISDIQAADLVEQFPKLMEAKNKREIQRAGKAIEKTMTTLSNITKNEESLKAGGSRCTLKECDSLEEMSNVLDNSIDLIITDPLYEIGHGDLKIRAWDKYKDHFDDSYKGLEAYKILAHESFRFTTEQAHGYIFLGPEHFHDIRQIFISVGWWCFIKPIIWVKGTSGQCNVPTVWPASCYEMILFIRKEDSQLIKQGQPDWVHVKPLHASKKKHEFEKPLELIDNLLERSSLPGQTLIDPFMGSGVVIEAGLNRKLSCTGFDIDPESYATSIERMAKLKEATKC